MLKFKCDRCGKEIARDEAWNITMVPEAYAAEEERRKLQAELKVQGELCMDCAEIILKEMIYLKEVPARDCHGALRLAMTGTGVPAEARQGCRALRGAEEGKARQGCRAMQGKEAGREKMHEGRYITIARKRARLTMDQLADKMYVSRSTLGCWERGKRKKIPWDKIEKALPEIKVIRIVGCEKFCPLPKACLGGGKCYYSGRRQIK